jgi:D-serine deaminase-like pyridoxal phosphate-dependent protein
MMQSIMPHQSTRSSVPTPALVIDLTALERNVAAMAALAARWGVHLTLG